MKQNGINHVETVPCHPASNGLAEQAVKTFKSALKKLNTSTLQSRVNDFLFKYRITLHTTTGTSPAQLLFGRQLRSQFDLLLPSIADKIQRNQNLQKQTHDYHARDRQLRLDYLFSFSKEPWARTTLDSWQDTKTVRCSNVYG